MDDQTLIEQLRADAERLDTGAGDPGPLVRRAVATGRRRRARRRVGAAVGAAVVAGVVSVALATTTPSTVPAVPFPDPAGRPVSAVPTPGASSAAATPSSGTRTPTSATPTPPASTGVVSGSPADVETVAADLLPAAFTVVSSSSARDEGANGFDSENSADLTVQDAGGTSYLVVAIGNGSYGDGCLNLKPCTKTTLPDGGIVWVTGSPAGDKAGRDRNITYDRADGGHVFLMQRTYASGNGPVTRTGLPFSDAEGRDLVTSARWDRLFRG